MKQTDIQSKVAAVMEPLQELQFLVADGTPGSVKIKKLGIQISFDKTDAGKQCFQVAFTKGQKKRPRGLNFRLDGLSFTFPSKRDALNAFSFVLAMSGALVFMIVLNKAGPGGDGGEGSAPERPDVGDADFLAAVKKYAEQVAPKTPDKEPDAPEVGTPETPFPFADFPFVKDFIAQISKTPHGMNKVE